VTHTNPLPLEIFVHIHMYICSAGAGCGCEVCKYIHVYIYICNMFLLLPNHISLFFLPHYYAISRNAHFSPILTLLLTSALSAYGGGGFFRTVNRQRGPNCRTRCNTLQHHATHCNTLQHTAKIPHLLLAAAAAAAYLKQLWTHTPVRPGVRHTLQHTATFCNTLQHTAYTYSLAIVVA